MMHICDCVPFQYFTATASLDPIMGKTSFSQNSEAFLITQWNCTTIGSCWVITNGWATELHDPMAEKLPNMGVASGY